MNILLAHQRMLFRDGLKHILMDLGDAVAFLEAEHWAHLLSQVDGFAEIDLALVELGLPGADRTGGVAQLIARRPALPVVVLAPSVVPGQVVDALGDGARGFVPETISAPVLTQALRLVLVGGIYLPPGSYPRNSRPARLPDVSPSSRCPAWQIDADRRRGLTARQAQVLELISQGKPNKLIARELGLAEGTVKCHVTSVLKMLNVRNRTSAAVAASDLIGSAALAPRLAPNGLLAH